MFQEILNNGFLLGALTGASTSADALWANLTNSLFLIVGFAALFLAIYVYKKDPHGELNKSFFYFGMFIFFWVGITGFLSSYTQNIFWLRLSSGAGAMVALSGLFFCCLLAQKKISRLLRILLIIMCGLMVYLTTFTSFFIEKLLSYSTTGFQIVLGPLYSVWAIHQLVMVAAIFYVLFSSLRHAEGKRKKQILYFILGIAIAAGWNMLVSVILPFFNYSGLSNIDSPAAIILVGFTSYSIIKYNLMDISSLFFKAFIYSLVIVAIIAFLLLLVFVSSFFFEQLLVWPIYVMVAIVSIALFFIGRLFFTEKRDLEEAKVNLTESLQKSEEDRRKAEIERDKTATIISSFSDGLIILDEEDKIFSINPEAEKILGLDSGRLLKKPLQSLMDFPRAVPVELALSSGVSNVLKTEVELAKDFVIELSVIPLNLDEKDIGHLIVLHDISREKIVENMKTEFVSLAAHQLRTPLSIIKWSMSMLKKGDFGKLNKKQYKIVGNAFRGNERLISLVNDLLNVSRIEEGRYLYKVASADMKEVIELALADCKDEIIAKKIKVDVKEANSVPKIMIDVEKMKLAIENLIDNAVKYSREGGKIKVFLKSDGDNIHFEIQDFGMGIPESQQSKVFTKFFRGDNATKVNAVGTGLGLFLVQNIIEAHGGKIRFKSEENKGTSFYLSLPIKEKV